MTPHPERDALLRAVLEAPDDDGPRLRFADWQDETGDPDRAEFIRVQCALAKAGGGDPARAALVLRERRLLRANRDRWFREVWPGRDSWRTPLDPSRPGRTRSTTGSPGSSAAGSTASRSPPANSASAPNTSTGPRGHRSVR